jgi:hypothetical protein
MRAYPAVANLQWTFCAALNVMTLHAGLRDAAVDAGAVHSLAAALHAHVLHNDVGLVCAALNALSRIAERHPLGMAQARAAGAIAAAVAVLRAHPASATLQVSACFALGSLTFDAENRQAAIQAGAIEAILHALHAHAADAQLQRYGCTALSNIATDHTAAISARSSRLFPDAVKAVVAALNAHRSSPAVQEQACGALWHLIGTDAHRVEAGKLGAVMAAVAALRAHPADANVLLAGFNTTGFLCSRNSVNAVQACGAGVLQAIVAALRAHPADVGVHMGGCNALNSILTAHQRLQAAAGAAGAVEAIAAVMRLSAAGAAKSSRSNCTALLSVMGHHRGNAQRACAAGVVEALAAIMGTSCAHEDTDADLSLYLVIVCLLDALLAGNDDAAHRAIHAGILEFMARDGTQRCEALVLAAHARVLSALQAAAHRHDAGACAHDGCKRCAVARDCGRMCALAGCGSRKRADGSGKRMHRCGACAVAAYCGPAHQREDWARHKDACAALGAANDDEGEQQPDEQPPGEE